MLAAGNASADPREGDVRLRDGDGPHHGRVEIYATPTHETTPRWGVVCDDSWDDLDARVVCRQLGYPDADSAIVRFQPPNSSLSMILDEVDCDGTESNLLQCPRRWQYEVGDHNCNIYEESAAVRCTAPTNNPSTDDPAVLLGRSSLRIAEGGSGSSYGVVLGKAPSGDVTVTIGGIAGSDLTVTPSTLSFTRATWSDVRTVTVTAGEDADRTDDLVTLSHTAAGSDYGSAPVAQLTVNVDDDEKPTVVVVPTELSIWEGDAAGETYEVVLGAAPDATVTVTVGGTSGTDLTASPSSLTFTTQNWAMPRTVTVTAADDSDSSGETEVLTHRASGGVYAGLEGPSVSVQILDDDEWRVAASPQTLPLEESGSGSYMLRAEGERLDRVTVTIETPPGSGLTVSPSTVTFTSASWTSPRTIQVTAGADADWEDDSWTITHAVDGTPRRRLDEVTVQVRDAGPPVMWIDGGFSRRITEGRSDSIGMRPARDPLVPVTVTVTAPASLRVSPASLTFNSSNHRRMQQVQGRGAARRRQLGRMAPRQLSGVRGRTFRPGAQHAHCW